MKNPLIVAADIDGTLTPKHTEFTNETLNAIRLLRKNNCYFGVASGRPIVQLDNFFGEMGADDIKNDFVIGSNGCELYDNLTGKTYEYYFMQPDMIRACVEALKDFPANPEVSHRDGSFWVAYDDDYARMPYKNGLPKFVASADHHELYAEPIGKLMFRVQDKDMKIIDDYIKKNPIPGVSGYRTAPMCYEFTDSRANKGNALKNFCEMHNISLDDVWSFGDTTNDNEMLQISSVGVCMVDGTDDTKACANFITKYPCAQNGFADFIFNHVNY